VNHLIVTTAVYQDGVLKPPHPIPNLADGDRVEVVVVRVVPVDRDHPDEVARRERQLKAWEERTAALEAAAPDGEDDDYDILEALNANRLREGARPLLPPDGAR
jgi:predicted DNA-binding antitoxin AbrB/MazE fold protein